MGYIPSLDEQLPLPLVWVDKEPTGIEGWKYYSVHVRMRDDHACTNLSHVDFTTRRMITENLQCYQIESQSRRSALELILKAVIEALSDEDAGVE